MTKRGNPEISIVLLSHNRVQELSKSLDVLCPEIEAQRYQIIVADNASSDGSREILGKYREEYPGMICVFNDENLGVAAGRNSGYLHAEGEFVLNLDEDAHIAPDDIQTLRRVFSQMPETGIVSPKVVDDVSGAFQCYHGESICEVGNFSGACYMFRKALLDEIGYLDNECTFGGEELDYSIRARTKGFSVTYCPDAIVRHNNLRREGTISRERMRAWLYNYIRIPFKHFPLISAARLSTRYLVSFIVAGLAKSDFRFLMQLFPIVMVAIKKGRAAHAQVPDPVTAYYTDPTTRPDLGNVTIISKITGKLSMRNR